MYRKQLLKFSIITLSLFVVAGCGKDERVDTQAFKTSTVNGKVTLNGGVPEYRLEVIFNPLSKDGRTGIARTNGDGSFKRELGIGEYKVTFKLPAGKPFAGADEEKTDLFDGKYEDPDESEFKVTIEETKGESDDKPPVIDLGEYKLEAEIEYDPKQLSPKKWKK